MWNRNSAVTGAVQLYICIHWADIRTDRSTGISTAVATTAAAAAAATTAVIVGVYGRSMGVHHVMTSVATMDKRASRREIASSSQQRKIRSELKSGSLGRSFKKRNNDELAKEAKHKETKDRGAGGWTGDVERRRGIWKQFNRGQQSEREEIAEENTV